MKPHNPLPPDHPLLTKLLDKYPLFFDQSRDSIHYKYHNTLASMLNMLKHDTQIIRLKGSINRPLQIWRHQTQPQKYTICYQAQIKNIKNITLYQEKKEETRVLDKKSFNKGIHKYKSHVRLESNETIPRKRFYMEVETYDGLIFQKGFPENDTPQNDIYDHDNALDTLGQLYNLPRRQYQQKLSEADYPYTYPLFCNSSTEWDYYYQLRLKNHVGSFGKVPLHVLMLENIFEISPTVEGRWRQVGRMDQDTMQDPEKAKYMASTHWNSNVYDITYNLHDLPRNLEIPDTWDIQKIIEETFPVGAKIFFQIHEEKFLETKIQIKEKITLKIEIKDTIRINDNFRLKDAGPESGY